MLLSLLEEGKQNLHNNSAIDEVLVGLSNAFN